MKKVVLCFVVILVALSFAHAEVQVPKFQGTYVNDYGSLLNDSEENSLNKTLRTYEDSTTNQIVILTLSSTSYEDEGTLFDYSQKIFETWGVGQKGKNNGVLIVLVKNPNTSWTPSMRITTGYGIEGPLPDIVCKRIIRSIRPMINEGEYYEGLNKALASITERIGSEFSADDKDSKGLADWQIIMFVFFAGAIIVILISYVVVKVNRKSMNYNYSGQNDDSKSALFAGAYMSSSDSSSDYSSGGDYGGDSGGDSGCDCGGGDGGGGGGGD